jgi:hypothetical protein
MPCPTLNGERGLPLPSQQTETQLPNPSSEVSASLLSSAGDRLNSYLERLGWIGVVVWPM